MDKRFVYMKTLEDKLGAKIIAILRIPIIFKNIVSGLTPFNCLKNIFCAVLKIG